MHTCVHVCAVPQGVRLPATLLSTLRTRGPEPCHPPIPCPLHPAPASWFLNQFSKGGVDPSVPEETISVLMVPSPCYSCGPGLLSKPGMGVYSMPALLHMPLHASVFACILCVHRAPYVLRVCSCMYMCPRARGWSNSTTGRAFIYLVCSPPRVQSTASHHVP